MSNQTDWVDWLAAQNAEAEAAYKKAERALVPTNAKPPISARAQRVAGLPDPQGDVRRQVWGAS